MVFSTFTFKGLLGQLSESSLSKHLTCVFRTYSQLQPTNLTYFSLLISRQVVGVLILSKHLCLQDSLPTSACRDILTAHLQASCRSFHCPNTSLVSPGLTPNFSLSRYSKHFKNMSFQAINWQVTSIKWPNIQHAQKWNKNTSSESRILKFFDALDFTSAMYQPSDHVRTLVQAQHRSLQKIRELNTNDSSFTLDGVLSTLQQGSAENGVGSSVELRYHVKKRRAQIYGQIQRFIKISTELRRQTRTSTTHTKHKRRA